VRPPGLAAAVRPVAGLPRPYAFETDRQGTGHGDRKCVLTLADHPIGREIAGREGVIHEPSGGRALCGAPQSTRQIEQCEPDRNPHKDPQTRTVDHGDGEKACEGHTFCLRGPYLSVPQKRRFEATEPSRAADDGSQTRRASHSPLPHPAQLTFRR
jgi:hypothetical protein